MTASLRHETGPHDIDLPQVFGRYLLIQRLSRGGMGEIFLAKHGLSGFEKICVIKKVLPHLVEDEHFISRFVDEAQVAIKLSHANIAQVFEVGRVKDEYFLALEFVEGRDLRRVLGLLAQREERMPIDLALLVGRDVAAGLSYAHRRKDEAGEALNLVHCDISPPNVMISFEGEVKLIDFGIAKSAVRATATDPRMGFGKFGYMAPEQLIRGGEVDPRTDIYAAGVVLFELLTGNRLYEVGDSPDYRALARMVAKGQHPLPSQIDPQLRPYDELVARALRPKPEERYQTAAAFRNEIQRALVKINPTVSPDEVGRYMISLFGDEVAEQRRMAATAQAADLSQWEELFTTQSEATISYALAHMPLPAPATEMVERLPAPTGAHAHLPPRGRRRGGTIAAVIAAAVLLVGGSVLAIVLGGGAEEAATAGEAPSELAAGASDGDAEAAGTDDEGEGAIEDPTPEIAALQMPPDEIEEGETSAEEAAPEEAAPEARAQEAVKTRRPPRRNTPRNARRGGGERDEPEPPADAAADEKRVLRKFRAVSQQYRKFRASYGGRLEKQWTDLATYAQYARGKPEKMRVLDRKLDAFRARMRDER